MRIFDYELKIVSCFIPSRIEALKSLLSYYDIPDKMKITPSPPTHVSNDISSDNSADWPSIHSSLLLPHFSDGVDIAPICDCWDICHRLQGGDLEPALLWLGGQRSSGVQSHVSLRFFLLQELVSISLHIF